ncbi:MAG: helix-turn-helix domain-containing protein [Bacteroidota bacterium]
MKTLGERIQHLRKQANLTQADLAKKIKISHTQMVRYEIRGIQPPADVLSRLSAVLNTSVDFLINGDKDQKAKATLKDAELLNQFKAVEQLPADKQRIVKDLIDAFIFRTNIQKQLAH